MRNRGELAEGWYDPATLHKAQASAVSNSTKPEPSQQPRGSPKYGSPTEAEESSDDDIVGPTLPGQHVALSKGNRRAGPAIPNLQDLELKRGTTLTAYLMNPTEQNPTQSTTKNPPTSTTSTSSTPANSTSKPKNHVSTTSLRAPKPAAKTDFSKRSAKKPIPTVPLRPPKPKPVA